MNRPPPIMEPEDEMRRLREENGRLRGSLRGLINLATHPKVTRAELRRIAEESRCDLNPAKSAAPFSS